MRLSSLEIRTPEGVVFSQLLAGPVVRAVAWFVDLLCISALGIVISRALLILQVLSPDLALAAQILSYFVVSIGYGIACEWFWRGQTIGKRFFRLRVVDAEGLRVQFGQIALRNLFRILDALPAFYVVGGVSCWLTRRHQRLGDMAANTVVIRTPRIAEPDLEQLLAGKFNSLREHPHLVARLRQRVSPAEAAVALKALLRREAFDARARVELFESLASHFRSKVEFPPEATEGIGAEQYVRNVVDVLYRVKPEVASRSRPKAEGAACFPSERS